MEHVKIEEMEDLVQKLDGVIAVKFVSDDDGRLEEVHVLADRLKNPKRLSRDIQSAVSAAYGYNISHSIISIAQIEEDSVKMRNASDRLKISGFNISYSGSEFSVGVTLEIGEQTFTGSAKKAGLTGGRTRSVADACVSAVNAYLGYQALSLYDIQRIGIGVYPTAVVAVTYTDNAREERVLTGTSVIRDDEYLSVIRAVLDAVNRILPQLGMP